MKRLKTILFIACVTLGFGALNAKDAGNNSGHKEGTIRPERGTLRPNAPGRYSITCVYGSGYMELSLPEGVEELTVTLYQDGLCVYYGVATPEVSILEIPEISGVCQVECIDQSGRRYVGQLEF